MRAWLAFVILSIAECILLTILPAFNLIIIILWGATIILAGVYLNRQQLIIIYLVDLIVLYAVLGMGSLNVFMLFFGIAVLTMSYLANSGKDYYFIQNSGMLAAIVSISFFLLFFYFGGEHSSFAELEAQLNTYTQKAWHDFAQTGLYHSYQEYGLTMEEIKAAFMQMSIIIYKHLPALYYLQAIMAVFFMLFLAHLGDQNRGIKRLNKKPFRHEIMPWQLVWVFIIGIGLWLWGRDGSAAVYYAGSNILVVMAPITIYYGLAIAGFILARIPLKRKTWFIILLIPVILIFTLPIILLLGLLGLFDALIDFRKIRLTKEGFR